MKFAICNETFQEWPFDKAFAFARQCGYTGIEFAPFTINRNAYDISADRRREIRRQAEDAGLEVVGLHWLLAFTEGYYLTSPEADVAAGPASTWASWRGCAAIWAAKCWCWARPSSGICCPA